MDIKDFYYSDKHAAGTRMPILLPSGEDSGEWLQVMGPDCNAAIAAAREYASAFRAAEDELAPLAEKCAKKGDKGDWTEYNAQLNYQVELYIRDYAVKLVTGWSFTVGDTEEALPFTKEALAELLCQYRALSQAVVTHHAASRDTLMGK